MNSIFFFSTLFFVVDELYDGLKTGALRWGRPEPREMAATATANAATSALATHANARQNRRRLAES